MIRSVIFAYAKSSGLIACMEQHWVGVIREVWRWRCGRPGRWRRSVVTRPVRASLPPVAAHTQTLSTVCNTVYHHKNSSKTQDLSHTHTRSHRAPLQAKSRMNEGSPAVVEISPVSFSIFMNVFTNTLLRWTCEYSTCSCIYWFMLCAST